MTVALGLDTSNYTTSAAVWQPRQDRLTAVGRLLPVKEGRIGLQQSEAVFLHTRQLPGLIEQAVGRAGAKPTCVGASSRPRDAEDSYMPCFLVGAACARAAAAAAGLPLFETTHQAGHVAAAIHSAGRPDLFERPFVAFHLSGGTTDGLLVTPDDARILRIEPLCRGLDLHAGQVVDRVGHLLGLAFPAGPALEQLALQSERDDCLRPAMKGADCCLSGVVNRCERLLADGASPADVARYALLSVQAALLAMTEAALNLCRARGLQDPPLLYAGGVMANGIIRQTVSARFGGLFAAPEYSRDNAAGVAVLAALAVEKGVASCPA